MYWRKKLPSARLSILYIKNYNGEAGWGRREPTKKNPKSSSFTSQLNKCILNILNIRGFWIILKYNELNNRDDLTATDISEAKDVLESLN